MAQDRLFKPLPFIISQEPRGGSVAAAVVVEGASGTQNQHSRHSGSSCFSEAGRGAVPPARLTSAWSVGPRANRQKQAKTSSCLRVACAAPEGTLTLVAGVLPRSWSSEPRDRGSKLKDGALAFRETAHKREDPSDRSDVTTPGLLVNDSDPSADTSAPLSRASARA